MNTHLNIISVAKQKNDARPQSVSKSCAKWRLARAQFLRMQDNFKVMQRASDTLLTQHSEDLTKLKGEDNFSSELNGEIDSTFRKLNSFQSDMNKTATEIDHLLNNALSFIGKKFGEAFYADQISSKVHTESMPMNNKFDNHWQNANHYRAANLDGISSPIYDIDCPMFVAFARAAGYPRSCLLDDDLYNERIDFKRANVRLCA